MTTTVLTLLANDGLSDSNSAATTTTTSATQTGNTNTGTSSAGTIYRTTSTLLDSNTNGTLTDSSTTTVSGSSSVSQTGNTTTSVDSTATTASATMTVLDQNSNAGLSNSSSTTTRQSSSASESGNSLAGTYSGTSSATATSTQNANGVDPRGAYSASVSATTTTTGSASGNQISGDYTLSQTVVALSNNSTSGGGGGSTTYAQAANASSTTTILDTGNSLAGLQTITTQATSSSSVSETGTYVPSSTTCSLNQIGTGTTTSVQTFNQNTGATSNSATATTSSTLRITASNSSGGYTQAVQTNQSNNAQQQGNAVTGSYSTNATASSSVVIQETASNSVGSSSYTETSTANGTTTETGSNISGDYTRASSITSAVTLNDSGSDSLGNFSIIQTDNSTTTGQQSGNNRTGNYSASASTSDSYSTTETVAGTSGFSLGETGNDTTTLSETGNTRQSTYSQSVTGSDNYSINETGNTTGGAYSEGLQGSETTSWTQTGNRAQQTFSKSQTGSGTYTRTESGAGATLGSGSGTYGFSLTEGGNWHGGSVSQCETGSDRYAQLEQFDNVTSSSNDVPGHLDFHPFGAAFCDPASLWQGLANAWNDALDAVSSHPVPSLTAEQERFRKWWKSLSPAQQRAFLDGKKMPGPDKGQARAKQAPAGTGGPLPVDLAKLGFDAADRARIQKWWNSLSSAAQHAFAARLKAVKDNRRPSSAGLLFGESVESQQKAILQQELNEIRDRERAEMLKNQPQSPAKKGTPTNPNWKALQLILGDLIKFGKVAANGAAASVVDQLKGGLDALVVSAAGPIFGPLLRDAINGALGLDGKIADDIIFSIPAEDRQNGYDAAFTVSKWFWDGFTFVVGMAAARRPKSFFDKLEDKTIKKSASLAKVITRIKNTGFPRKLAAAASRLGINLRNIKIVDGVAEVHIGYARHLREADIKLLRQYLRQQGAKSAVIHTSSVIKGNLFRDLQYLARTKKKFYNGARVEIKDRQARTFRLIFDSLE